MRFVEKREFGADPAKVWARASDVEGIPTYWHGTKEIRVSRDAGKVTAEVVFAFGGRGRAEVTTDDASRTMTLRYVEGPFRGEQRVSVGAREVEAEWDVKFKGAYRVLGPWNQSHFRSGTKNALLRLCEGTG
jgi:Polyketide cyclase / dehydrase and lipid transport